MKCFLQVFCIIFSGLILSLAIPNELYHLGSPFLGLISLIPLYIVYRQFKSYKQAFLTMGLHAITVHLVSSFWLCFFKDFAAFTLGASALGTGVLGGCVGLAFYLPFSKKKSDLENYSSITSSYWIVLKIFWFCVVYVAYEWVKSCGFLGYPWGTLSSTMFHWKILCQIVDITGTYGLTFLITLFTAVLAEGIMLYYELPSKPNPKFIASNYIITAIFTFVLFLTSFAYGTYHYFKPVHPVKELNAILVQQNEDPWTQESDNDSIIRSQELTEQKIKEAKKEGKNVDIVIWSEGCLKYQWPRSESHYQRYPKQKPLTTFIQECNVPFILGGSYRIEDNGIRKLYNSALLFDSNGTFRGFYGKNHLVPMAESIPFATVPAVSNFLKKIIHISAGFVPGNQYTFFEVKAHKPKKEIISPVKVISLKKTIIQQREEESSLPYVKISTPICFDDAFPDVCRPLSNNGAEVFINITDDSWSKTKSAEYQHFVISSFRTIECRISMARSCNSGYSVVLDSKGNILNDLPLFEEAAMFTTIPIYEHVQTLYLRFGNWLPHLFVLLIFIVLIYTYITKDKQIIVYSEREKLNKISKKYKKSLEKESSIGGVHEMSLLW